MTLQNKINNLVSKCIFLLIFTNKNQTSKVISELKTLNIKQLYTLELCKLMYDFKNSSLPLNINNQFALSSSTHNHGTRFSSSNGVNLPFVVNKKSKSDIFYSAPQ